MIPRILVPLDIHPVQDGDARTPPRRLTTLLDSRTVVPTGPSSGAPLDGRTSIPAHLPLGVLVDRTIVPRGMPPKPFENFPPISEYVPLAILDSRVVVPAFVAPPAPQDIENFGRLPQMTAGLREIVEPDLFITGDANLLVEPEEKRSPKSDLITRSASVLVHVGLIVFLVSIPKLFPPHVPTREEIELARKELSFIYMPPETPSPRAAVPPGPKVRISPNILRQVAPPRPVEQPKLESPPVNPERPPSDLPSAPSPRPSANAALSPPSIPAPSHLEPIRPPAQRPPGHLNLQIPQESPGKAIQDQLQDAIRRGGSGTYSTGGSLPRGGGGGGGGPSFGNGVTILTPTEGVDFDSYINRLLAVVKRSWYTVMPESAMMGDKGIVVITFHINRDGSVPMGDPALVRTSGKEPLDTAAMSAIRTSSPFEPLPPQFSGPYIELRFIFLYNLPLDYAH